MKKGLFGLALAAGIMASCDDGERLSPVGACHLPEFTLSQAGVTTDINQSTAECVALTMGNYFQKNAYWQEKKDTGPKHFDAGTRVACVDQNALNDYIHDYLKAPNSCEPLAFNSFFPPSSTFLREGFIPSDILSDYMQHKLGTSFNFSGQGFIYIDRGGTLCVTDVGFPVENHPSYNYGDYKNHQTQVEEACGKLAEPFSEQCPVQPLSGKLDKKLECMKRGVSAWTSLNPKNKSSVVCMNYEDIFPHMSCSGTDDPAHVYMGKLAGHQFGECSYPACYGDGYISSDGSQICGIALQNLAINDFAGNSMLYESSHQIAMSCE